MKNVIVIKNLSTYYDNVCALSNINLTVKEKDFLAILGPNGGGKSTLLKNLLGLVKPSKGSIKIMGKDLKKCKNTIGYVPQFSKFDKKFPISVLDTVLCGTLNNTKNFFHTYTKENRKFVSNILKQLNLYEFKNRQIGQLSGGQLQRVLIARALAVNPKILILDEPTASLDVNSKSQIYSILKDLNKTKTIIIVSHDINDISSYVNSIACLNKQLYYHGNPESNDKMIEHIYGYSINPITYKIPTGILETHKE
ncbi:metal ABC transporter ATP-binding protein [Haloimpatiens sp. FM7330]|uniref:metal ABC transporter ATP-binding protein n=1 Tax=Haloimpatiens sp. FM7330 TaxID=3298610 RepID=UPI00363C2973